MKNVTHLGTETLSNQLLKLLEWLFATKNSKNCPAAALLTPWYNHLEILLIANMSDVQISPQPAPSTIISQRNCGKPSFFNLGIFVYFSNQCDMCSVSILDVDCPDSWSRLDGHCYSLLTGYHEMSVCRADCLTHGGDLASIHSGRENEFLADLIKNRPVRGGEKVRRRRISQWGQSMGILDISRILGSRGRWQRSGATSVGWMEPVGTIRTGTQVVDIM